MLRKSSLFIFQRYLVKYNLWMSSRKRNLSDSSSSNKDKMFCKELNALKAKFLLNPVKSHSDKKEYRLIKLENGLKALLISDPYEDSGENEESIIESSGDESDEELSEDIMDDMGSDDSEHEDEPVQKIGREKLAACALLIDVGSFSDPREIQGLSHFLEHLIFMGSEKYPEENDLDKYINKYGGSDNAFTECEHTVFYFEIVEKAVAGALDRFAQLFISPLMLRGSMDREREAVESEFQMNKNTDSTRTDQLLGSLAHTNHPASTFTWGNLKTLKESISDDELYAKVHEFRKLHYVADKMHLCLQSRLPLDDLQALVEQNFSGIKASVQEKSLPLSPVIHDHTNAFKPDFYEKMYFVKPKADQYKLLMTWVLPSFFKDYKSKPHHYLSFVLGHEGQGSLTSFLRENLLALDVQTGMTDQSFEGNSMFSLFSISILLTDKGYNALNSVLEAIFSFLLLLQQSGSNEVLFRELQQIEANSFKFREDKTSVENVEDLVVNLKYYSNEHALTGPELYFEYDPKKVEEIIEILNQRKFNLMILTKDHKFDKKEKWFETDYEEIDFPTKYQKLWDNRKLNPVFHLPEKNSFICTNFEILYKEPTKKNLLKATEFPEKIFENACCELWYRQDDKFLLPHGYIYMYFVSPIPLQSAKNSVLMNLFSMITKHHLSKILYPAKVAGLYYQVFAIDKGLMVKISGYNEKLHLMIEHIIKYICTFENMLEENVFETYRAQIKKNIYNTLIKPQKLNNDLRLSIIENNFLTSYERFQVIDRVTLSDLKAFVKEYMKELMVQVLIQGNLSRQESLHIIQNVLNGLSCAEIKDKTLIESRARQLPIGNHYLRLKSVLPNDINSTVTNYYQIGKNTLRLMCLLELFEHIISEPLFDILRTQEQLGYAVSSTSRDNYGILGFSVTIQSQESKHRANLVDDKIEEFLFVRFASWLKAMPDKQFNTSKTSLIKLKKIQDPELKTEIDRNWAEVTTVEYLFDRNQREAECLMEFDKKHLMDFYNNHINILQRQKMCIQVIGSIVECPKKEQEEEELKDIKLQFLEEGRNTDIIVSDVEAFKKTLFVYPVIKTNL